MNASPTMVLADLAVLTQPLQRTLIYSLWYAALLWLPIRGMAAVVDRHKVRVEQLAEQPTARDERYHIGMPILPPM